MLIVFHCVIDTALTTPLKLQNGLSAKKLCHILFKYHKEYKNEKKNYKEQVFIGTTFKKNNCFFENDYG